MNTTRALPLLDVSLSFVHPFLSRLAFVPPFLSRLACALLWLLDLRGLGFRLAPSSLLHV
jgi:hypothetical protein